MNDELMGRAVALHADGNGATDQADTGLARDTEVDTYADPQSVGDLNSKLGDIAAGAGLRNIEVVAWRDLDHPEAGGSEVHAARISERWAAAGIEVALVASRAPGAERTNSKDGYQIRRPAGRYSIFPVVGASALAKRGARPDATIEVWNGMPFFSPAWAAHPRVVFLHHVHDGMWNLVLPAPLAASAIRN